MTGNSAAMAWLSEWGFFLIGSVMPFLGGLALVCWGIRGRRDPGVPHCPKCWYPLIGLTSLACPECGFEASTRQHLLRPKRRRKTIVAGCLLILVTAYPLWIIGGFCRERLMLMYLDRTAHTVYLPPRGPAMIRGKHGTTAHLRARGPALVLGPFAKCPQGWFLRVTRVAVSGPIGDARLLPLASFHHLETLSIDSRHVGKGRFSGLKKFRNLRYLTLTSRLPLRAVDLAQLSELRRLERLSIRSPELTNEGIAYLKHLTNLRQLTLTGAEIDDGALAHLSELAGLQYLSLDCTDITDAGLAHLAGLTQLAELSLQGTRITGAGFVHLKPLSRLRTLSLEYTDVSDESLSLLGQMSNLQSVRLSDTNVTDRGRERFEKQHGFQSVADWSLYVRGWGEHMKQEATATSPTAQR